MPDLATSQRDAALVDRSAAGAAFDVVRRVELLLDHWGVEPPSVLRSGGLAVRDLKAVARAAARRRGRRRPGRRGRPVGRAARRRPRRPTAPRRGCRPTSSTCGRDCRSPGAGRDWSAAGWRAAGSRRWSARATRPARPGTRWPPSCPAAWPRRPGAWRCGCWPRCPRARCWPPGPGVPSLVQRVGWLRPRRPTVFGELVAAALTEAAVLGRQRCRWPAPERSARGRGRPRRGRRGPRAPPAPSGRPRAAPGRPDRGRPRPARDRGRATAPPARRRRVARRCHRLPLHRPARCAAASTSAGPRSRSTTSSTSVSRTPVPQPLDLPRRRHGPHLRQRPGRPRGGVPARRRRGRARRAAAPPAGALARPAPARPDRAIATTPIDVLLPRLRELGAAPVVEAADGTVRVSRPDLLRARSRRGRRPAGAVEARQVAQVQAVATAIRAGDRAESSRPVRVEATTPSGAAGRAARGDRGRHHRADRLRRQPRRHAASGSSTRVASTAAGSPPTTTAPTTCASSRCTGSPASGGHDAAAGPAP